LTPKKTDQRTVRVKLSIEDIEPLENAIKIGAFTGSGLVWYKGEGWDWRMARNALDDLKAKRNNT